MTRGRDLGTFCSTLLTVLLLALLLTTLAFLLVLRSLPLELGLTLRGLFLRLGIWCGRHSRDGMGGFLGCGSRVMHLAIFVGTNRQLAAKLLAIDDDGGLGRRAWRHGFGVRVVGDRLDFSNRPPLNGSRSLFLGIEPSVLDLDETRMCGNFPVKKRLDLAVVAV